MDKDPLQTLKNISIANLQECEYGHASGSLGTCTFVNVKTVVARKSVTNTASIIFAIR